MAIHTVAQGETVDAIARAYAVERSRILGANENAELFTRRTAFQLFEGDELFIPDSDAKQVDVGLCSTYTFCLRPHRLRLRARFQRGGAPRSLEPVSLSIDDGEAQELSLDRLGWLDTFVAPDAKQAKLTFFPDTDHAEVVTLKLGHLDPVSETRGLQQRLNNLGFDCGAEDNDAGERTSKALLAFQATACATPPSGEATPETHAALCAKHSS